MMKHVPKPGKLHGALHAEGPEATGRCTTTDPHERIWFQAGRRSIFRLGVWAEQAWHGCFGYKWANIFSSFVFGAT